MSAVTRPVPTKTEPQRRALVALTPEALARLRDPRHLAGWLAVVAGAIALFVGWWQVSGTLDPGRQMAYVVSGGIGGVFLLGLGMSLLFNTELAATRAELDRANQQLDRLTDMVQELGERLDGSGPGDAG